jgi:hypothetical protein
VLLSGLLGGILGMVGSVIVSRSQNRRAQREEWFRRVQWAEELTASDDERRRTAGYRVLGYLSRSSLATDDRTLLLELANPDRLRALTSEYEGSLDGVDFVGHPEGSAVRDERSQR